MLPQYPNPNNAIAVWTHTSHTCQHFSWVILICTLQAHRLLGLKFSLIYNLQLTGNAALLRFALLTEMTCRQTLHVVWNNAEIPLIFITAQSASSDTAFVAGWRSSSADQCSLSALMLCGKEKRLPKLLPSISGSKHLPFLLEKLFLIKLVRGMHRMSVVRHADYQTHALLL